MTVRITCVALAAGLVAGAAAATEPSSTANSVAGSAGENSTIMVDGATGADNRDPRATTDEAAAANDGVRRDDAYYATDDVDNSDRNRTGAPDNDLATERDDPDTRGAADGLETRSGAGAMDDERNRTGAPDNDLATDR